MFDYERTHENLQNGLFLTSRDDEIYFSFALALLTVMSILQLNKTQTEQNHWKIKFIEMLVIDKDGGHE